MQAFKSPTGIDFGAFRLPATVVHFLLAGVAFALTAVIWLGAAQASRSYACDESRLAADEVVTHVTLAPVLIVGHRDRKAGRATAGVASLASTDCAKVTDSGDRNPDPIRVTLQ